MTSALRIGVDLRFADQLFKRGMGRYTLQQLHATITATPHYHYVLFCIKEIPPSLQAFSAYPNVTLYNHFVCYPMAPFLRHPKLSRPLTQILDRHAHLQHLDLFHIPILQNFVQPIPTRFTSCRLLITIYDFIPMIFREHFLQSALIQGHYERGIAYLKEADYLLAISMATKQDAVRLLSYAPERIGVAYPAVDSAFIRLDDATIASRLSALWQRLGISAPSRYLFTVTDHFYTKNLETLLRAYADLAPDIRQTTPLIITFDILPHHRAHFLAIAQDLGIAEQVIFTGRVSEDELVTLYNGALFTVYPSRYEGFGYPVAEAMACGSPVITTTAASMPEVAGDAAMLVSADDVVAFTQAMNTLLASANLREKMRADGFMQADKFNLQALAQATITAYQTVYDEDAIPAQIAPPAPSFIERAVLVFWYIYHDSPVQRTYLRIRHGIGYHILRPIKRGIVQRFSRAGADKP